MEDIQIQRKIKENTSKIILNLIITIIWLYFIFTFITANSEIENKKTQLREIITKYDNFKKNWLKQEEFITKTQDESIKNILNQDKEFYKDTFKNSNFENYDLFLDSKNNFLQENSKETDTINKENKISNLIPNYQDWVYTDWNMTDLDFISYVESILNLFWLKTSSNIFIWEVLPLDKDSTNTLSSQIFYIPLNLELSWNIKSIENFLIFSKNLGKIIMSEKDDNFEVYNDKNLNSLNYSNTNFKSYNNIYNNPIFSIEKIDIPNFLNNTENVFDYKMKVDLIFYVKWLPTYVIERQINEVKVSFEELNTKLNTKLTDKNLSKSNIEKVKSLSLYMKDLQKVYNKLNPIWEQIKIFKDNLLNNYKDAYKLKINIESVNKKLNAIN